VGEKISQFSAVTTVASGDYFPVVQASDTTNKRVSLASLLASVPLGAAATPSIAFTGDTDTGIYSPGANQVAISTNGTGRLFVDAAASGVVVSGTLSRNGFNVVTVGDVETVTSTMIASGTIIDADVNISGAINATKLRFLQVGASGVARTVDSKLKDTVSVKDFGAVGNGTTDDTAAIQAAFDYASTSGRSRVIFPYGQSGIYLITSVVNFKSNTIVDGQFNTIKLQNYPASLQFSTVSNVLVENLIINGNAAAYTAMPAVYPFISFDSQDITIRKCTAYDMEYAGFAISQGGAGYNYRVLVENCHFYNCGTAGNVWSYGNGIAVTGGANIVIRDNVVHNVAGVGGINLEGTLQENIVIQNNRIYTCTGAAAGIKLYAGGADTPGTNVVISNNIITDQQGTQGAIWIQSGYSVIVANNIIADSVWGTLIANNVTDISIKSNIIKNCTYGTYSLSGPFNSKLINNQLICASGASASLYNNMYLIESGSSTASTCIATGNVAIDCPSTAFTIAARSPVIFTGNVVTDCRKAAGAGKGHGITYLAVGFNKSIIGNNIIIDTLGNYGTRFYGFYNFEGSAASNLVYLEDNWTSTSNGMPRYWLYAYAGYIQSEVAIVTGPPSAGYNLQGDIVWNAGATAGGYAGWICTATGSPGTWKTFGAISV